MVVRFAVDRRCAPVVGRLLRWRWRIGSMVRGKYWMAMEWYRRGNEVVSRKKAERKGFNNTFYIPTDCTDWH